jgi:D,D-heptose 1,7-bisphosphate phosphatase
MSNKAVFLDRDNTLIKDPGYISHPDQVELLDGVAESLIELKALGYKLIVVTNQSAVARGMVTEKVLAEIHERTEQLLGLKGASLDRIYYCPYHPEGVIPEYRRESDCRKPNPGMLLTAAEEMDIDLRQSWMIGNGNHDIEAGLRAGCKTILVNPLPQSGQAGPGEPAPDYKAVNMKEAVNLIKKFLHSQDQPTNNIIKVNVSAGANGGSTTEQILDTQTQAGGEPPYTSPAENSKETAESRTEQLLSSILDQLKAAQRTEMFSEFSVTRLIAGILQIMVLFCLLITLWLLTGSETDGNSVMISLGFAAVLQLMSLTFFIMHVRK